jgi:hypothetical protein
LSVTGNISATGNLSVVGTSSLTGAVTAANNLSVSGNLAVTGTSTLQGALTVNNNIIVTGTGNPIVSGASNGFSFGSGVGGQLIAAVVSGNSSVFASPANNTGGAYYLGNYTGANAWRILIDASGRLSFQKRTDAGPTTFPGDGTWAVATAFSV